QVRLPASVSCGAAHFASPEITNLVQTRNAKRGEVSSVVVQSSGPSIVYRSPWPDLEIPDITFTGLVLGRARELGDKPALVDAASGRTLSYRQLASDVRQVAAGLAARGFGKGDVLGIYSPNLPEYAVVFHAVAILGGITTTVNPLYTADELAVQLNDCHAH